VEQEVEHTNKLLESKMAEIQTETHLRQLASRALGRNQVESKKLATDIETVQSQLNDIQGSIYKANDKMDEFKMQMDWNQEELEQWAVAAKQKDDDNLTLQKYARADELKIKELNLRIEHLTKDLIIEKSKLHDEATETMAKQTELDRIAIEFRDMHAERQSLVAQWRSTVEEMKSRDREINEYGERFARAKVEKAKKELGIATQRKRLLLQQSDNKDVEARSEALGRIVSKKREEMINMGIKIRDFRDELESLKNELTTSAEAIITKRSHNMHKAQTNDEKRVQLERHRQNYQKIKNQLEDAKNSTTMVEQSAKKAEEDVQLKEKDFSTLLLKSKALKDKLFKESQSIHELKSEEARLRTDISGTK
jgi:chromosome segregation ATPase